MRVVGFWIESVPSLVALFILSHILCPSLGPPRLEPLQILLLLPLAWCVVKSVTAGSEIGFLTRLAYGIAQGSILVAVHSNLWSHGIRSNAPYDVAAIGVGLTVLYAVIFASITHAFSVRITGRQRDPMQCETCGYLLRGLREPRCPECNTPFDPSLLGRQDEPTG